LQLRGTPSSFLLQSLAAAMLSTIAARPLESRTRGDDKCADLAISIAVSCMTPPKQTNLGIRCGSAPVNLNLFGQRQSLRRSPQQTRRAHQRRRSGCAKLAEQHGKSFLDLSSLDFSLRGEREPEDVQTEPMRIGLNEQDVTAVGVASIARALASVRLSERAPLTELQLAYNQVGDAGVASLSWAAMQGALLCLDRLVLTGNKLTRLHSLATAFGAAMLPSLAVLYLSSNRLTAGAVAELASSTLPDGTTALGPLRTLWLDHNAIGVQADGISAEKQWSEGADALGALLRACPKLDVLGLGSNFLCDAHLAQLSSSIASGTAFSERSGSSQARLDLSLNNLTFAGVSELRTTCAAHGGVRMVV